MLSPLQKGGRFLGLFCPTNVLAGSKVNWTTNTTATVQTRIQLYTNLRTILRGKSNDPGVKFCHKAKFRHAKLTFPKKFAIKHL